MKTGRAKVYISGVWVAIKLCFGAGWTYFHVSDHSLEESSQSTAFLLDHSLHFQDQQQWSVPTRCESLSPPKPPPPPPPKKQKKSRKNTNEDEQTADMRVRAALKSTASNFLVEF